MYYIKLAADLSKAKQQLARIPNFRRFIKPEDGENFVLGYLDDSQRPVSPKEICDALHVSSARVAAIINRLESKDMVRRTPNSDDGRYIFVELLSKGRLQRQKNIEKFYECAACFLEVLGPEDAAEYVRLQKKIADIYTKELITGKKDIK